MEDILVPIALFFSIAGAIMFTAYLRHKRTIAMIEHGLDPKTFESTSQAPKNRLESALITTGIGLALTIGLGFIGLGPWLLGGLIPLFIGLARLLAYLMTATPDVGNGGEGNGHG